jgi:hypothetical protein
MKHYWEIRMEFTLALREGATSNSLAVIVVKTEQAECRAPLQKGCPKHHGHKGNLAVTPETCGANGEKAQVILVWVRPRALRMPPIHRD